MSEVRPRFSPAAAALVCGLLVPVGAPLARSADSPAASIQTGAQHLAVDARREAHHVRERVTGQAHQFQRQLLTARSQMSLELHQLGQRMQRWWQRVGPG